MLGWLKKQVSGLSPRGNIITPGVSAGETVSAEGWILPCSADELLASAGRPRLMQALWENCPLSASMFESLWLSPLRQVAELAQSLPLPIASGEYGRRGGLLDAVLSVSVCAVRLSKSHLLPPGAPPEEQAAQSSAWCTAIYYAALFSLAGELGSVSGETRNGKPWLPALIPPTDVYRFRLESDVSASHYWRLMIAGRLLPQSALIWLSQWPPVLQALLSYLDERAGGMVSVIVGNAWERCGLSGEESHATQLIATSTSTSISQNTENYSDEHPVSMGIKSEIEKQNNNYNNKPDDNKIADNMPVLATQEPDVPMSTSPDELVSALHSPENAEDSEQQQQDTASGDADIDTLSILDRQLFSSAEDKESISVNEPTGEHGEKQYGRLFFEWIVEGINSDSISVNERDGFTHVVSQFLFLKTPECFFKYLSSSGVDIDKSALQQLFEACSYHHTRGGKGIYTYRIYDNQERAGKYEKIAGYMIPITALSKCKNRLVNSSPYVSPNN
ncbi:TraI domain-containing protein [Dickeya zeae]|uniref:TraI domain-containing protein n=1 Tax=Dickeya zeae TaxID=204042 RepID=UPI0003AA3611|nr:TraI domain-containing protein [Dickeya zeae]